MKTALIAIILGMTGTAFAGTISSPAHAASGLSASAGSSAPSFQTAKNSGSKHKGSKSANKTRKSASK